MNSAEQLARIRELADAADAEGAVRWTEPCELPDRGFWFPPTVFTDVAPAHRIAREEVFGPVLAVLTFRTPEEAVARANNTPYGLSAGVWTEKGSRILWMADRLQAGVVWANTFNRFDPASPFGGYKESGYGREGGRHGPRRLREGCLAVSARPRRLDVRKTYKLYIGGAFPRSESGRTYEVRSRVGRVPRQRRARLPQGRPGRRRRRAQGAAGLGGGHGVQPRAGPVPGRGDARGPARPVRRRRSPPPKA